MKLFIRLSTMNICGCKFFRHNWTGERPRRLVNTKQLKSSIEISAYIVWA